MYLGGYCSGFRDVSVAHIFYCLKESALKYTSLHFSARKSVLLMYSNVENRGHLSCSFLITTNVKTFDNSPSSTQNYILMCRSPVDTPSKAINATVSVRSEVLLAKYMPRHILCQDTKIASSQSCALCRINLQHHDMKI